LKTASRILLLCPLALFALSIIATNLQGPFYYGQNSDPEYVYLLNGLNIDTLQTPGHTDHPGTTLQVIDGVIILIKWALSSGFAGPWQSLQLAVLTHPEDYLHAIGLVLNLLLSAALYFAARRIYQLSDSLLVALVFQISFGMFMETFHAQARVSPEPLLITAAMLLFIPLAGLIFDQEVSIQETEPRLAVAIGLALAFGMVTKITFAPMLAVCLLFRTRRALFLCLSTCVVAAVALLFPVWSEIPRMLRWFGSLLLHKQRYGHGPVGFPSLAALEECVRAIRVYEPMLFLLPLFYAASYTAIRKGWMRTPHGEADRVGRLLLAGMIAIAIQVVITLKHFALHYLLPAMLFTMLLNAALVFVFRRAEPGRASRGLQAAALVLLAIGAWRCYEWMGIWKFVANRYQADTSAILDQLSEMKDCTVIPYYRASSQPFALAFGNENAHAAYTPILAELYPGAIYYHAWNHEFYSWKNGLQGDEIRRSLAGGRCFLMQGTPFSDKALEEINGFSLTPVLIVAHSSFSEAIYRLGLAPGAPAP
jgi:hypothetical protein